MPPKPNIVAEAAAKLDDSFGGQKQLLDPGGKKIIKQGKARLLSWERKRIENEAKVFWSVYFKQEQKKGRGLKNKLTGREKKGVAAKLASKVGRAGVDKRRVAAEARIFWQVYYKVKKRKEPKKDIKGRTKISPAKKAIAKVKGAALPKKKGWFMQLIAMLTPFIRAAIIAIAPFILKIGLLVAAIVFAINKLADLFPAWKAYDEAVESLEEQNDYGNQMVKDNIKILEESSKRKEEEAKKAEGEEKQDRLAESKIRKIEAKIQKIEQEEHDKFIKSGVVPSGLDMFGKAAITSLGAGVLDFASNFGIGEGSGGSLPGGKSSIDDISKLVAASYIGEIEKGHSDKASEIYRRSGHLEEVLQQLRGQTEAGSLGLLRSNEELISMYGDAAVSNEENMKNIAQYRAIHLAEMKKLFLKSDKADMGAIIGKTPEAMWENELFNIRSQRDAAIEATSGILDTLPLRREGHKAKKVLEPSVQEDSYYGTGVMPDFVMRPGMKPVRFDSKDDILGFKAGGPVSNLLKHQSTTDVGLQWLPDKIGRFQLKEIQTSNHYLKQLVGLTIKLLQKGSSGKTGLVGMPPSPLPPDNSIPGDMSGPTYTDSRSDFYGSAYSMHTPVVPT